ncbi:MAG: Nif3-like dinuclear metal center hexameric protein [Halofilum sp. (in: g-proteobacteria)]|nr:Nif3-like dinuclear metal center hexameric protein [Halofilum sp. (in: g-proteobacteria)]
MIEIRALVDYCDELLDARALRDFTPNGLQVEGRPEVRRIMSGVTASQPLLEAAADWGADALLVHHGWFWKNEPAVLTGMKGRRVRTALAAGFSLVAYHLPLDVHARYGNNAELGRLLGISVTGQRDAGGVPGLLWHGRLEQPLGSAAFGERIESVLARAPMHVGPAGDGAIETVAWCTGAGQDFIDDAAALGVDAFVSGEVSERTTHAAREQGIHYYAAGHHATERYGVLALAEHLAERHDLAHRFVDIDNPA